MQHDKEIVVQSPIKAENPFKKKINLSSLLSFPVRDLSSEEIKHRCSSHTARRAPEISPESAADQQEPGLLVRNVLSG